MRTRILPALAFLPLAAGCTELVEPRPEARAGEVAAAAAVPVAAVAPRVAAPAPAVAADEPAPASVTPVSVTPPTDRPVVQATLGAPPPLAADGLDEEDEAAAEAPADAPAPGRLGTTVASLGPPAEGGLWLETPLVEAPTSGRVEYNGTSVTVQLRPSGGEPGSGSQISLEAMRALGAPLTGLPELVVFAG